MQASTDYKAKQAAQESAAQAMHAAFPHLTPVGGKVDGLQAAAKNIRIELKAAFPSVKFSVKSRRFSMGDAIDVSWEDGPTTDQVEDITGKYQAGSFNGQTDCYEYGADSWTRAFGDAKYVHTSREASDKAILSAIRTVSARYDLPEGAEVTPETYKGGKLWSVNMGGTNLQEVVGRTIQRRTWAIAKAAH